MVEAMVIIISWGTEARQLQWKDERYDQGERWVVGAHRTEIEPRFGELGKDSCIVTSRLRFEGCQSSRSWERSILGRANYTWKIRVTKEKACLEH